VIRPSTPAGSPRQIVVETRELSRVLGGKSVVPRTVLEGVTVSVPCGQLVALTGASGSGKSTLLYLLGALDRPTSGDVWLDGTSLGALDDDDRAQLRNERLGFVFQFHFLLPEFTVLENVILPVLRRGVLTRAAAEEHGYALLELLGLGDLWKRKPGQLSGGQQQRVSIARALANDPSLLLADEPTGNLDSRSAEVVFEVFARLAHEQGRTIVMVTHAADLAARADRQIVLRDGRVVADEWRTVS
jgi:lipoprotein-releasing system ATP-binding protein